MGLGGVFSEFQGHPEGQYCWRGVSKEKRRLYEQDSGELEEGECYGPLKSLLL